MPISRDFLLKKKVSDQNKNLMAYLILYFLITLDLSSVVIISAGKKD